MTHSLKPRQAVLRMAPYSPPLGGRSDKLRLDFNENTLGCSPKVIEFLRERLNPGQLAVYPEYDEARRDLAHFFGVKQEEMLLTNGTDEAIQVLINTYVDDNDQVVVLRPAYAMYRFYAEVAGACIREIDYRPDTLEFPEDELLDALGPETKAVLIANPNNPTGTGTTLRVIERILDRAPEAAVLIDEAYFEFCGVTAMRFVPERKNLFVSRTFSKVFGMAGMRLGCLFSAPENVAYLHKAQSPYSVNSLAAIAARGAVRDPDYIRHYVDEILAAREMLCRELDRLRVGYFPSQGNFVLMKIGERAIEVRDLLRSAGVLVRDRSYEIAGCVRVTVGTRSQIKRFVQALEEIW